jgi:XTP/dITP diphosphohydrolase
MIKIKNNNPLELLLATTNAGKLLELHDLLKDCPILLLAPSDLGLTLKVEETGVTYAENAVLKAKNFCQASGLTVLSDDTGLEVDALYGAPGLHSARYYSLPGATDANRRAKLLAALNGAPHPWTARFRCVVAVAIPGKEIRLFEGSVEGEIITRESGDYGFGYDRIFWIPAAGKTLADLDLDEKNQFSHRAVAVKKAIPYLIKTMSED